MGSEQQDRGAGNGRDCRHSGPGGGGIDAEDGGQDQYQAGSGGRVGVLL